MSAFSRDDSRGQIKLTSDRDITLESDRDMDGAGDLIFRTGGVERARISAAGVGSGWPAVLGGLLTYPVVYDSSGTGKTGLRRWRAALGDALYGRAVINVCGDSIAVGIGSDGSSAGTLPGNDPTYRAQGWVGQLRSLFATTYGDPGEGAINNADSGSRVTLAGGATASGSVGPLEGGAVLSAAGHTATFALPTCTEIDIYTWDGSTTNNATYNVDGAGAVNFAPGTNNASALTWKKTTITGLANTTHSIVITAAASGSTYIAAVAARKLTTGVQVNRWAKSGNTTNNLVGQDAALNGNSAGQTRMLTSAVKVPQADLVIIELAVNDFTNQNSTSFTLAQPGSTPTQLAANIQLAVNTFVAAGACVLVVGEPRQNSVSYPSPLNYTEANYYAQCKAIAAATDHCAFVDLGEVWGENTVGQTLGLYNTGSVHPVRKGHGDIARILFDVLTRKAEATVAAA